MKKALSLVLAITLAFGMTSFAFAATGPEGRQYSLGDSSRVNNATKGTLLSEKEVLNPDDKIYIPVLDQNGAAVTSKNTLSKDNITASVKTTKGSNLIEKPSFEVVNGAVYMTIEVSTPFVSTKAADLKFTAALAYKKVADKTEDDVVYFDGQVKNKTYGDKIDTDGEVYDVESYNAFEVDSNFSGKVSFDFGSGIMFSDVRVFSGQKFYLNLSQNGNADISNQYGDKADLAFYNFVGSMDNFSSTGTLSIPAEKNVYVYKLVDGKLSAVNYDYDNSNDTVEIQTRTLDSYVFSDIKLDISETAEEVTSESTSESTSTAPVDNSAIGNSNDNPGTGVNSMLNIAAVAGVLGLAVAGIVTLKK